MGFRPNTPIFHDSDTPFSARAASLVSGFKNLREIPLGARSVSAPLHLRIRFCQFFFVRWDNAHRAGFVLGDFSEGVQGIDGKQVGGGFDKVHRDKDHAQGGPLCHPRVQNDGAAAR